MTFDYVRKSKVALMPEDNAGSDPFENCGTGMFPRLLGAESFGKSQVADLPLDDVFDPKIGKLITIGRGSNLIPYPEGSDETTLKWELSLTRLK